MWDIEDHTVLSAQLPKEGIHIIHGDLLHDPRVPARLHDGVPEDVHDAGVLAPVQELQFVAECLASVPCQAVPGQGRLGRNNGVL